MHSSWFCLLSAGLAGGITLFALDSTFIVGGQNAKRAYRSAWWWGFIVANAALACAVFFSLRHADAFASWSPWAFSVAIGVGYLALVRLKFATISYQNQEVPVGLDTFYESGRQFVFRRINEQIKADREVTAQRYLEENDLQTLGKKVRLSIELDALLAPEEKRTRLRWLLLVIQDERFDQEQKKLTLAIYLASGAQS